MLIETPYDDNADVTAHKTIPSGVTPNDITPNGITPSGVTPDVKR